MDGSIDGLVLTGWSSYAMTGWTPDISQMTIVIVGVIQGVGLGFLFVPLSTATLSTLSPELRAKASAFSACRATSAQASASRW